MLVPDQQERRIHWADTTWEEAIARVRRIEDRLGMPVDDGIVETVAIFNILGFVPRSPVRPSRSCAPWPWIEMREIKSYPLYRGNA